MRLTQWLGELRQDVTFALRQLRSSPTFTLVAVVTLALGIGVNAAIFALVDATLLRALPLPSPDRLVMVWERTESSVRGRVSPLNLLDWNERSRAFEVIGAFAPNVGAMVMSGADGTAENVSRQWVTARVFEALGVHPIAGRTFVTADDVEDRAVVVLSEAFWEARFDRDPGIIGRDLRLDGEPFTVLGIVPNEAHIIGQSSIWALLPITGEGPGARSAYSLLAIGRLKPGVTLDAAQADMADVAAGLARDYPATNQGRSVTLDPLHDVIIGSELRQTSLLFLGVVGFVLLISCANVANLLLARASMRMRELAIRAALGAGRGRVIRQLLTESLLLSAIGGAFGAAIGALILQAAPSLVPAGLLPAAVPLAFDSRVLVFCGVAALIVGIAFGLAPAWRVTDLASARALAADSRTTARRGGGAGRVLVAGEIAVAVLLLFGAGLLLRTLIAVEGADRGYRADRVLSMIVDPLGSRYPTAAALLQFYAAVEEEVRTLPGIESVAWATTLPLGRSYQSPRFVEIVGAAQSPDSDPPAADYQIVSPAYFRTVDVPVVSGRTFDDRDTRDSVPVCIVNEAFARRHLQGRSPIGVRVAIRPTTAPQAKPIVRQIVGVARQVKGRPDETEALEQIYVPLTQHTPGDVFILIRAASGRPEALGPSVRAAIGRVDTERLVGVRSLMSLEAIAREATGRHRFRAVLVTAFAGLALVLAMVGVFGILAYSVQQRIRELGVRRALGATTGDILRLVAVSATRVVAAGAIIGLVLATMLGQLLRSLLFGVQPLDPLTFALVPLLIVMTATIAIAGPAWRAVRVDPALALRAE